MIILVLIVLAISVGLNLYLYIKYTSYDGKINIITKEDGKTLFDLELESDPYDIQEKTRVVFQVVEDNFWKQDDPFAG